MTATEKLSPSADAKETAERIMRRVRAVERIAKSAREDGVSVSQSAHRLSPAVFDALPTVGGVVQEWRTLSRGVYWSKKITEETSVYTNERPGSPVTETVTEVGEPAKYETAQVVAAPVEGAKP